MQGRNMSCTVIGTTAFFCSIHSMEKVLYTQTTPASSSLLIAAPLLIATLPTNITAPVTVGIFYGCISMAVVLFPYCRFSIPMSFVRSGYKTPIPFRSSFFIFWSLPLTTASSVVRKALQRCMPYFISCFRLF